jgi:hypothetical protein
MSGSASPNWISTPSSNRCRPPPRRSPCPASFRSSRISR